MIQGIAYIIGHYFFQFVFIGPYIDGFSHIKHKPDIFLFKQNLCGLKHIVDHTCQVKPFHLYHFIAKLQFIQREQIFDHRIHLPRLVNDHVTVKFPAFRIVIDACLKTFRIPLNQSNRRLQLMRHIGQKLPAHLVVFLPLFDIPLQFIVRRLQF